MAGLLLEVLALALTLEVVVLLEQGKLLLLGLLLLGLLGFAVAACANWSAYTSERQHLQHAAVKP